MNVQRLSSYARAVILFFLGVAVAVFSLIISGKISFSSTGFTVQNNDQGRLAAVACVPESKTDNIFFISCGGIY
jgi:hypothetical protein